MIILVPRPAHKPLNPIYLYMCFIFVIVDPSALLWLYNLLTIVSAGWEAMAQNIPAKYPEVNVIDSWVSFE